MSIHSTCWYFASIRKQKRILQLKELPVIDLAFASAKSNRNFELAARQICDAAHDQGFFYVSGHGLPDDLVESVFNVSRKFFSLPAEKKNEVEMSNQHRGFLGIGSSVMEGYDNADAKESFVWGHQFAPEKTVNGNSEMLALNRWPSGFPKMRLTLNEFFESAHLLAYKILQTMAMGLGAGKDHFTHHFRQPTSRGSLIHYPAQSSKMEQFGVSPHTDFGCLSLLIQRDPGLYIQSRQGEWLAVQPKPGTIVVNVGDLMERWSNGRFRSVPHYVVNENNAPRYSIVVFVDPNSDTLIDPFLSDGEHRRYEPVECAEYITNRFDKSFTYRN